MHSEPEGSPPLQHPLRHRSLLPFRSPLDAALPVDPRCDTCMDAKAFTDMVARSEKNFTERVREAEAKK
jgi:hypothetical protein